MDAENTVEDELRCERACTHLCNDFAWTVDQRDYRAFVDLFTEGGAFERPGQRSVGHAAIRQFLDTRPVDRVTRHIISNIRINMTGPATATGTCSALMYQATHDSASAPTQPLPVSAPVVVDYVDDYALTSGGWKFACRRTSMVFQP
ncbi:MAG TPA: nuclear transport factor 2 family protein [Casimicrobiaceae bacterium]|nr:nuclear transport factor 2 family protein [Casimicrobiaceae bacterium]